MRPVCGNTRAFQLTPCVETTCATYTHNLTSHFTAPVAQAFAPPVLEKTYIVYHPPPAKSLAGMNPQLQIQFSASCNQTFPRVHNRRRFLVNFRIGLSSPPISTPLDHIECIQFCTLSVIYPCRDGRLVSNLAPLCQLRNNKLSSLNPIHLSPFYLNFAAPVSLPRRHMRLFSSKTLRNYRPFPPHRRKIRTNWQ